MVCDKSYHPIQKGEKHMNLNKLKAKIVEKGMNVETLAENIGVDRSSMYRKLNNFDKISIGEAKRIKAALDLTNEEASVIFLA
jgi:predicted transcriptional regulator